MELVKSAVDALEGTVSEKLAAVESAMKAQTTELGSKISLVDASVKSGFADAVAAQELIKEAVASLAGTVAEKLAAVESAVKSQMTELSGKLVLIQGAIGAGFADNVAAIGLVKSAVESLEGTVEEKLKAIEKSITDPATGLTSKLTAVEVAIRAGLVGDGSTLELVKKAIDALNATASATNDKLDEIKGATGSPTSGLDIKLDMINAAIKDGLLSIRQGQELIRQAMDATTSKFSSDEIVSLESKCMYVSTKFWDDKAKNDDAIKRDLKALLPLTMPYTYEMNYVAVYLGDDQESSTCGDFCTTTPTRYVPSTVVETLPTLVVDLESAINKRAYNVNGYITYRVQKVPYNNKCKFICQKGGRAVGVSLKLGSEFYVRYTGLRAITPPFTLSLLNQDDTSVTIETNRFSPLAAGSDPATPGFIDLGKTMVITFIDL